jgi:hypothetical protein
MVSFREAAKKKVPVHDSVSMQTLAQQLGLARPVSLSTLIADLNASPPDFVIFDSGKLGPSSTTGEAYVGMTIDGGVAFRGYVREGGEFTHTYAFGMVVDNYTDASGKVFLFLQRGTVGGTLDPFHPREDDWAWPGTIDPFIADHWDSIKASNSHATLQVDLDPALVITEIVDALSIGIVFVILFPPGKSQVHWPDQNDPVFRVEH